MVNDITLNLFGTGSNLLRGCLGFSRFGDVNKQVNMPVDDVNKQVYMPVNVLTAAYFLVIHGLY